MLLFVNGACSGAGLTLLNNMAQLARSPGCGGCCRSHRSAVCPLSLKASCVRMS